MSGDDITTLGISVDSRPVDKGKEALDKLAQAGAKAEKATEDLTSATKILNKALGESEDTNRQNLSATERFVAALKKEADTIGMATSQLRSYEAAQLKLNAAQRASVDASIKAIEAHEKNKASATQSVGVLGNLKSSIAAAAAAYVSLNAVIGGTKAVIDATIAYERLTNILKVAIGSTEGAAREIAFLREESNKLGLQFQTAAEQYAKLAAAAKGTALEGKATRDIFLSIANASTVLGLSADQTGGVLTAVQQIISKNKVSTEELLQIAERMPGTFSTVANSLGLTGQELSNMLQKGNLVAKDLLPALAAEWQKTFGPQAIEASKSLNSQINRFDNALNELKVSVGKTGLIDLFSGGLVAATNFVNYLNTNVIPAIGNITKIPVVGTGLSALFGSGVFAALKNLGSGEVQAAGLTKVTEELDKNSEAAKKAFAEEQKFIQLLEEGKKYAEKYADPIAKITEEKAKLKLLLDAGTLSQDAYNRGVKSLNELLSKPVIKQRVDETNKLNKAQQDALRVESEYVKLLQIERKQQQDLIAPYKESAKQAADRLNSMQDEITALKLVRDRQISMKQAVELTTIARLEEKKTKSTDSLVIKEIESEIAARRKVIALIPEYEKLEAQSRNAAGQVSQQWIQAGRNIQSALSNSIFDFFNDGLDGMVRSLKSAVLRMLAEFAALKISESIGSMLLGSGVGIASSVAGGGSVNLSSGLAGVGGTGAGASRASFLGRTGMSSGQIMSMASMAGPYGAAAAAAVIALNALDKKYGGYKLDGFHKGIAGFTSAMTQPTFLMDKGIMEVEKLFGTNFVSKATPTHFMRKTLGISPIEEIIGKALFGRGPYKFRQQSIQGDITSGGLDGSITDVYKSKGGLLVGTKHKSFDGDIPSEIIRDVDKSIKKIYSSTHEFAVNLGMDANLVDKFTKEIQIKSDKNKTLTTEQVGEMLRGLQDEIATNLMPNIDSFKLTGETAGVTLQRLNNEMNVLTDSVQNLGGSASFAKELIMGMSIDARSAVVDLAGGIDKLIEKTQFFSENFLSGTEQLAPTIAMVNEEMAKLGFASVTTKEQFRGLVQSLEISAETRNALLDIAPAFLQIINAAQQIRDAANQNTLALAEMFSPGDVIKVKADLANDAMRKFGLSVDTSRSKVTELLRSFVMSGGMFTDMADDVMKAANLYQDYQNQLNNSAVTGSGALSIEAQADNAMQNLLKSVDVERNRLTEKYNDAVKKSNERITAVTESVTKLRNVAEMVRNTISDIAPMSLEQARSQIANGTADSSNLSEALNVLRNQSDTSGFSNVLEFRRSQGQNANILTKFSNSVENQLTLEQRSLAALESARDTLDNNFKRQNDNLDQLIIDAQAQVEHLKGIYTNTMELPKAIGEFNRIIAHGGQQMVGGGAVSGGSPGSKPPVSGNLGVSSADIVGYITTHSYMESYKKARELGVTSAQIAATGIFSQQQINDWVKQQNLASFDVGGRVPKTGIAMIHKDEQILTKSQSDDMNKTLAMLVTTVQALTISNNQMKRIFQTWDGNGMPPVREVDEAA